jgi:hypothetical protein
MGRAWHGTNQWVVLGPPLQPFGRHGTRSRRFVAARLVTHPLVAGPIKGTTYLPWSIIVVMYQVFKYYGHHVMLVKNSYENKVVTSAHDTMGRMDTHGLNKGTACRAWAEPSAHGLARHSLICYPGHAGPSS